MPRYVAQLMFPGGRPVPTEEHRGHGIDLMGVDPMRTTIVVTVVVLALLLMVVFVGITASTVSAGFGGGKGVSQTAPPPHRTAQLSAGSGGGKGVAQTAPPPHRPKFGIVGSA